MLRVIDLSGIIYADVLFIINTYITYILLFATAFLSKENANRIRLVLSSLLGGAYAFVILLDSISTFLSLLLRLFAACVFILVAFKIRSLRRFIKLYSLFFLSNFVFAGFIMAVWYTLTPGRMYYGAGVLYLDISTLTLVVLSGISYFVIKGIGSFIELKTPKSRVFHTVLTIGGKSIQLKAFLDTGNALKDPFTGEEVLIASEESIKDIYSLKNSEKLKLRYIPCSTVSGDCLMPVFRADKIEIKGADSKFFKSNVLIGVTKSKIKNGDYDLLLCDEIIQNTTEKARLNK